MLFCLASLTRIGNTLINTQPLYILKPLVVQPNQLQEETCQHSFVFVCGWLSIFSLISQCAKIHLQMRLHYYHSNVCYDSTLCLAVKMNFFLKINLSSVWNRAKISQSYTSGFITPQEFPGCHFFFSSKLAPHEKKALMYSIFQLNVQHWFVPGQTMGEGMYFPSMFITNTLGLHTRMYVVHEVLSVALCFSQTIMASFQLCHRCPKQNHSFSLYGTSWIQKEPKLLGPQKSLFCFTELVE